MANNTYNYQGGPFWDWVASMSNPANTRHEEDHTWEGQEAADPWDGHFTQPPPPHTRRPYPGSPRHGHRGPPPPHFDGGGHGSSHHAGPPPPPPPPPSGPDGPPPPGHERGPPPPPGHERGPPPPEHGHGHHEHHGHHRGRSGGRGRGGRGRGGPCGGRRGFSFDGSAHGAENPIAALANMFGFNGQGFGGAGFDMNQMRDQFESHFGLNKAADKDIDGDSDFTPSCDVFDKPDAYIVHFSLAGAKKEDVSCNWDADKSELHVAGVIYRPADEETLKTLALNERSVGVFGRRIKLGSKAHPANIDSDAIAAKMEDGILIVTVPKNEEFEEIKKVDIE